MAVVRAFVNGFTSAALTIVPAPIVAALTGTITCAAGAKLVVGTGTAFVSELTHYTSENKGGTNSLKAQYLIISDTEIQEIDYVINDTTMYLKNASVAGFSGAASRACNPVLKDLSVMGISKTVIVPGGSLLTTANNDATVIDPNDAGVVPPMIVPTGVSVSCSHTFEYYKP